MDNQPAGKFLPVSHFSYSSLSQLFRNPLIWKLKYILHVYDGKRSVASIIGSAGHEALKVYYGGNVLVPVPKDDRHKARELAIAHGLKYINEFSDSYINYGKTGKREDILSGYAKAMQFYFAEEPAYNNILMCEERLEAEIKTVNGELLPLPMVAIPDIVEQRADGGVDIVDTKFVKTFSDYEVEDYIKILQGESLWHVVKAAKNITADRMVFREIKYTENSKENVGKPQIRDWVFPFSHEPYRMIFYNLFKDAYNFISNPDSIYLPNLSDQFDGEQSGLLYAQGLITADMSDLEVAHKVKDVALVSKKFVPSSLEHVDNQHLNPEEKIKLRLAEFGIPVEPDEVKVGSSVTQYRFKVSAGIRMSVFEKHKADIMLAIAAKRDIRILAPIPGTSLVGIEVANDERTSIKLSKEHLVEGTLSIPIGMTVNGEVVKEHLDEMPHLLIAGTTGSGKSVLLHNVLSSLSKQNSKEALQFVLIDPKRVELTAFKKDIHLDGKIIHEYPKAEKKLLELTNEMERRYDLLETKDKRDITAYNKSLREVDRLPKIVVVVDELADLMLRSKNEEKAKKKSRTKTVSRLAPGVTVTQDDTEGKPITVEDSIIRLAQMARAIGIHLILATQRPSVDVITGLIKANFPTRIALTTASATDSKIILGQSGAEKLNGKGDMLFMHPGRGLIRLQGFNLAK